MIYSKIDIYLAECGLQGVEGGVHPAYTCVCMCECVWVIC
jgi:hypothetical protein